MNNNPAKILLKSFNFLNVIRKEYLHRRMEINKFVLLLTFILVFPVTVLNLHAKEQQKVSSIQLSPTGHEVRGNQWLFVIGIDAYYEWPHLSTAVNDARTVRDVLLNRYYFDKYHLVELYNEDATRKNILGKLRFLARRVGPDDSIVIFYAGHGDIDSITKESNWIPVEGGIEDTSAWITNYDIRSYLKIDVIVAKHILLISDACFSGEFFQGLSGKLPEVTDKVIKKAYKMASRQAMTSVGLRHKRMHNKSLSKNSIFTHFLVKALEDNRKPFLIPSDLFPSIKAGVVENTKQLPSFGPLKGLGGQGGELVFFLKQFGDVDEKVKGGQITSERHEKAEKQASITKKNELTELERFMDSPKINLRSEYKKLSVSHAQTMPHIQVHKKTDWGFYGYGTIRHDYELKPINGGKVVIDHTTELMWHQSGSESNLNYKDVKKLLEKLNKEGYAGYHDWRLPTLEEAVSLLEPEKKNDLYINEVFHKEQSSIWTGDQYNPVIAWRVDFDGGSVSWGNYGNFGGNYIRPVRYIQKNNESG